MKKFTLKNLLRAVTLTLMFSVVSFSSFAEDVQQIHKDQVTMAVKNLRLSDALDALAKECNVRIFYNSDLKDLNRQVQASFKDESVEQVMKQLLRNTNLDFEVSDNAIVIIEKRGQVVSPSPQSKMITVTGKVISAEDKSPVVGATVVIVGTTSGVATDADGRFSITVNDGDEIEVRFIGMTSEKRKLTGADRDITIVMKNETVNVEEVVVTGYFERNKNSFTGAAKTISGDQLRAISSTNILNSLSILDPAVQIQPNNEQGSNPNAIPELIIRGTNSLNTTNQVGVNSPLIVIDGVESTLRALYDIDIFNIESVTVLKDAAATALYGEQASNGVILVTRKRNAQKEVRVSYNFTGKVDFPDLSDYDLMNAAEKLDFEKYSEVYKDNTGELYKQYLEKLARVQSGINTDWIAKPLRNSFSHIHNVNVSGEGSGVSYQVSGRYGSTNGVMKDDNRTNLGLGFFLSYNYDSKVIATLRADYDQNRTEGSKYGKFQDYVNANPYDAPYDEAGELQRYLSYSLPNPLYESTLSNLSKTKDKMLTGSLNVRWNIIPGLYVVGFGSLASADKREDEYVSPKSVEFKDETDPALKGRYRVKSVSESNYLLKLTANFNRNLDSEGSMVSLNAGGEMRHENMNPYEFQTKGFFNDNLTDPTFGAGFPAGSKVTGGESSESATVAALAAANIIYRNRYFLDGSYRLSGSSKFGRDKRWAPFWSVGGGWNLHRENFLSNADWIDIARLRVSYGHTGSINFSSYQAITTYRYSSNLINKYGMGASPITMGNTDLKWQTTKTFNVGLTSTFFKNRLDVNIDYYDSKTVDMIVPISMPPSTGTTQTYNNVGEQTNKGIEFTLSGVVIDKQDMNWRINLNAARNVNKLVKIGNTLRKQNDQNAQATGISPLNMYIEGESTTMLYAVKSAGIDPASGKEIYITKDGEMTYAYNPLDKVALGDATPKLRGAISSFYFYKGFSVNVSLQYSLGGYIYNTTRAMRIEQINPKYNADRRAYTDRWKEAGDVVDYLKITPDKDGNINTYHTERFVEKENYLSLSYISLGYEFNSKQLSKIGFKRLNLSFSMNDIVRFSTVRQERGTLYPFSRGFSFTVSPTF